jgi:hypothetical protein
VHHHRCHFWVWSRRRIHAPPSTAPIFDAFCCRPPRSDSQNLRRRPPSREGQGIRRCTKLTYEQGLCHRAKLAIAGLGLLLLGTISSPTATATTPSSTLQVLDFLPLFSNSLYLWWLSPCLRRGLGNTRIYSFVCPK